MDSHQEIEQVKQQLTSIISKLILVIGLLVFTLLSIPLIMYYQDLPSKAKISKENITSAEIDEDTTLYWTSLNIDNILDKNQKELASYGKELIMHTAKYLGPKGSVLKMSNGLNCQNCHLQAGTAVFGNNFGSVASMYPKFRARSGSIENIHKRINDCFERSLDGNSLDTNSKEMRAIATYINYIGGNVKKGEKAVGSGFKDMDFLNRAADPKKGLSVYQLKCQSCHQANGEGLLNADQTEYVYPALWGNHSFNDGAGLYRITNFAKYVKYNMPQGVTHKSPMLADEEVWDVASYVLSQKRPHKQTPNDWPDISKKPIDHPFGPYSDSISERQHKYGPFQPIVNLYKQKNNVYNYWLEVYVLQYLFLCFPHLL
ncbi:MAG: c-type cytochrome [Bacteroidetes bacterium]|nr:c-type cytochrome [Bacteroidota bacterium]